VTISEYFWKTGIFGLLFRYIFKTDDQRAQSSIVHFLCCNQNQYIVKYGKTLIQSYLPLEFSSLFTTKANAACQEEGAGLRQRGNTIRKTNYINLHGEEFDEKAKHSQTSYELIEQELDRLSSEYSESLTTIWSVNNTKLAEQLIEQAHFEQFRQDPAAVHNCESKFENKLIEKEIVVAGIILRVYNKNTHKA